MTGGDITYNDAVAGTGGNGNPAGVTPEQQTGDGGYVAAIPNGFQPNKITPPTIKYNTP